MYEEQALLLAWLQDEEEGHSRAMFVDALLNWIIENKDKKASFRFQDYGGNQSVFDVALDTKLNDKMFNVYVDLYKNGIVDLSNETKTINVDPEKFKHTGFYLSFPLQDGSGEAFKIWTYSFWEFELLLEKLGYSLTESEKENIKNIYTEAIKNPNNNCNDLDVIYETIPDFVIKGVSDDDLFAALESISSCSMSGYFGTDEEKAILNIIKNFKNANYIYSKLEEKPVILINSFKGLQGENREEFYYALLNLTAQAINMGKQTNEIAVGQIGIENLYNLNVKTIKAVGDFNNSKIEFKNIKNDYWDITGIALVSRLTREETDLFSASPLDIVATEISTSRPGSVFKGNGIDKTFVRQPAICLKYILDEQEKQFNWERLGQLSKNASYAALFYVGVEYALPYMAEKVFFQRLFTDVLAQVFAKTFSNGGDLIGAIEDIDYFNAAVKGLMGSKYKIFQEILKTYGDVKINSDGINIQIKDLNEESMIELFHRLIFIKYSNPGINDFSWDVIKKITRSEMEALTNEVIDDIEEYLKQENELQTEDE
jgi:hypothetical protein